MSALEKKQRQKVRILITPEASEEEFFLKKSILGRSFLKALQAISKIADNAQEARYLAGFHIYAIDCFRRPNHILGDTVSSLLPLINLHTDKHIKIRHPF